MPAKRYLNWARWGLLSSLLSGLAFVAPAQAQPNLLTNGSFELDADGTAYPNAAGASTSGWRFFAVGGATGSATVRAAAASQGSVGLELVRDAIGGGDSALDKAQDLTPIPHAKRVYQFLLDAKDGGTYGASSSLLVQTQYATSSPWVAFDPAANFETFGLSTLSDDSGTLSVRVNNQADSSSVYVDNLRVLDVTDGNRVVNGGFENSTTRLLNWRHFSLAAGELLATLETAPANVHGGAQALRLERTATTADGAVDLDGDRVPVQPYEAYRITVSAKKISGDAATRLMISVPEFNASGTFTGTQKLIWLNPGSSNYETFSRIVQVGSDTYALGPGLRVGNNAGSDRYVGAYYIDDFKVERVDNLLANGDFEAQDEGDANSANAFWRLPWPSVVGMTAHATAASEGRLGAEIATATNASNWIDRWLPDNLAVPTTKPGVYKLLADLRDGGVNGGQDNVGLSMLMMDAPYPETRVTVSPEAAFETFGLTAPCAGDRSGVDVRLSPSNTPNQSFQIDNIRVLDVTRRNRVVNGGFENSATRLTNWRFYSLNGGEFTATLDADAASGARALRIERTFAGSGDNDAAVDLDSDRVAVIGGESLSISVAAKKLSGDANARLSVIATQFDGATLVDQTLFFFEPGATYGTYTGSITVNAAATALNISLRVGNDSAGDRHVGAYLLDDVQVLRNSAPAFTAAALVSNAPINTVMTATASGWSDADGDAEHYTYQWKLNGSPIVGATGPVLDATAYGLTGSVTCEVTAYDGIASGNTIATAPVNVPVALSTFSAE